jgi:hypothetical protein
MSVLHENGHCDHLDEYSFDEFMDKKVKLSNQEMTREEAIEFFPQLLQAEMDASVGGIKRLKILVDTGVLQIDQESVIKLYEDYFKSYLEDQDMFDQAQIHQQLLEFRQRMNDNFL